MYAVARADHILVKAKQNEIQCGLSGQLMVCRASSPTLGVKRKLVLSGEQLMLVYIPSGMAYGYKVGPDGATLM